jgi:hypothetical protein
MTKLGSNVGRSFILGSMIAVVMAGATISPRPARGDDSAKPANDSMATIPPGTTITMANWQQYRQFMPDGIIALFEGSHFWKMPADVELPVGPTVIHQLPRNYLAATENHSNSVRLVELPDGGLSMQGYQGGIPFPNPAEPHKGWKIMTNLWFHYMPHLSVDTYGAGCGVNAMGGENCFAYQVVSNQLSFNTDPGVPPEIPNSSGKFFTQWFMFLEPEEERYTASLQIDYTDLARAEDFYIFLPALRRSQPLATSGRCAPQGGTDTTAEDFHYGFDSNLTEMDADYVGPKKMLALLDYSQPTEKFPGGYLMPLVWPKPSWGRWQVRNVEVIGARKIPAKAAGYCYGRRVMYIDRSFWGLLWEELYDTQMQPWKYAAFFPRTLDVPGVGPANSTGSDIELFWDLKSSHLTATSDPAEGHAFYVNQQAPNEYNDLPRYTTTSGLNLIMR